MGKYDLDLGLEYAKVLDDSNDSLPNLLNHKRIIKALVGQLNQKEDLMEKQQAEFNVMKSKIGKIIYEAEKILGD